MNVHRLGAIIVLAAALTGCSRAAHRPAAESPAVGSALRLATCDDWSRSTGPQRLGTVRQLTELSGGAVPGRPELRGPELDDQQAYDMFERACVAPQARAFKLYKLYGRAAAFTGH